MAGDQMMWLVWNGAHPRAYVGLTQTTALDSTIQAEGLGILDLSDHGWRCSQITVKEADDEQ